MGTETGDDAAVWRLDDHTCVVATTDFFMPMVDDPYDFGRIAATNALSDIYAMGGRPIFALAILGMPIERMPTAVIREILRGGSAIAADAGIPIAGGHSIDSPGADLRPRRDRATVAGRAAAKQRGARRRRPHIDEAPWRRRLLRRDQERRTVARGVPRDDRGRDATSTSSAPISHKTPPCTR